MAKGDDETITKKFNSLVFPGCQGGPLMHVIAAKAVAFKEALEPEFKVYQQQVVENARAMAEVTMDRGYKVVSGGTDNHLFLVDLIDKDITGKDAEEALGRAHITCNKNTVPGEPRSPFVTSGPAHRHAGHHHPRFRRRRQPGTGRADLRCAGQSRRRGNRSAGARCGGEAVQRPPGLRMKNGLLDG